MSQMAQPLDRTESLIESFHQSTKNSRLILNPDYLDDERLPEEERAAVLREIFNRNIREKQLSKLAQHLTPILDGSHPPSLMIFGPTGSGKTASLLHFLFSFQKVCQNKGKLFRYVYIDLTSPKTYFGALNELARALDDALRRYRKGIPVSLMQERIATSLQGYHGFLCLLIDEADNVKPNADEDRKSVV